jgi:hypothetical protein
VRGVAKLLREEKINTSKEEILKGEVLKSQQAINGGLAKM